MPIVTTFFLYITSLLVLLSPFALVERFCRKWTIGEKVIATVSCALFFLYLSSFLVYMLKLRWGGEMVLLLLGIVFVVSWRHNAGIFRTREMKQILFILGVVNLWLILLSGLVFSFSGGNWVFDWFNHYLKTCFFYFGREPQALMDLPDRPPLMNLVTCLFLYTFGYKFYVFQILFIILNSLCVLPMLELGKVFSEKKAVRTVPFLFFLLLNPAFVENCTYSWTKLLTAFFILAALHFYLKGWVEQETDKLVFSWILMGCGMLTHYSAGPYAVLLGIHYVGFVLWKREHRWREFLLSFCSSLAIFCTWIAWSLSNYGVRGTFLNNPSVIDSKRFSMIGNLLKTFKNIYYTVFPHFLTGQTDVGIRQTSLIGYVRDFDFLMYQTNLYFTFGLIGLPLILFFLYRNNRNILSLKSWTSQQFFWIYMLVLSFFFGIAVHGGYGVYGLMHICSQPLVMLGVVYLAVNFRLLQSTGVKMTVAMVVMVDAVFGIFLHFYVQSFSREIGSLAERAGHNLSLKITYKLAFFADDLQPYSVVIWLLLICFVSLLTYKFVEEEALQTPS